MLECYRRRWSASLLFTVVFLASVSGCSPKLNWRRINSESQSFEALFPAKPEQIERQIEYRGYQLHEELDAVKVGNDIYSIATIVLVPQLIDQLPELIDQLKQSVLQRSEVQQRVLYNQESFNQLSGFGKNKLPVSDYFIAFQLINGSNQLMRVRWLFRQEPDGRARVYQISLLRSQVKEADLSSKIVDILSSEEVEPFFEGFRPD